MGWQQYYGANQYSDPSATPKRNGVEMRTRVQGLSIAKPLREHRNRPRNQDSTVSWLWACRYIVVDNRLYYCCLGSCTLSMMVMRLVKSWLPLFSIVDSVKKIWADGGYRGEEFIQWVKEQFDCVLEVVENKNRRRFSYYPDAGRGTNLCLVWSIPTVIKDYERKPTSSTRHVYMAWILTASCNL